MFRVEVRDKQVYDIVAGDYGILWDVESEQGWDLLVALGLLGILVK